MLYFAFAQSRKDSSSVSASRSAENSAVSMMPESTSDAGAPSRESDQPEGEV